MSTTHRSFRTVAAAGLGSLTLLAGGLLVPATAAAPTPAFCNAGDVSTAYRATDSGAGHRYGRIVLRNVSDRTCRTHGYGGVSYVDADGHQVGASATRTPSRAPTVVLHPGQRVVSELDEAVAGNYPRATCKPVAVASLQVYVPEGEYARFVAHRTTGCANPAVHLLAHRAYRRP